MFELSWPGVRYCLDALRQPKRREDAIEALAHAGPIQPSTAGKYLRMASRLGLIELGADGRFSLTRAATRPEDLLESSTLVRFFRAWSKLKDRPESWDALTKEPLRALGVHDPSLLHAARTLAHRIEGTSEELPPHAALLLELTRLWAAMPRKSPGKPLWSTAEAFDVFCALIRPSGHHPDAGRENVERFLHACTILYNRNLVRIAAVQYAIEANEPFRRFRTKIGYLKSIYDPRPFEKTSHAESVQAAGSRLPEIHRLAGGGGRPARQARSSGGQGRRSQPRAGRRGGIR